MPFFPLALCYNIFARSCTEIKIWRQLLGKKVTYIFRPFRVLNFFFFCLFFLCFSYLFAAVIDLLLGFLPVQTFLRKHHRDREFLPWNSYCKCSCKRFCFAFSLKFLSIFMHISGSIALITLTVYHWKDLFLLRNLSINDVNFGQKWNKGQHLSQLVMGSTGVDGLSQLGNWPSNLQTLSTSSRWF